MNGAHRSLVVGTRGSALALVQTDSVCDALRALYPGLAIRVERITTTGDVRAEESLAALGRGIFVTEIEAALRAGRIDFAVHSAKDLPSTMPDDLTLAALLPRADARDVLVSRAGTLRELPAGARVGTSSPRRACQLRALRPDIEPIDMRGNVDTRLRKLARGEFDAIVLAAAGLIRLGRAAEITEWIDVETMLPCVGQGALAVEARADDAETIRLLSALDDAATRSAVVAERAFLAELGAGCRAAAAAHAIRLPHGELHVAAMIGAADGRHVRSTIRGPVVSAADLGSALGRELLLAGGAGFLGGRDTSLAGKRIAITRPPDQSAELVALLRAREAEGIACPTISIAPVERSEDLDDALMSLSSFDWIVFTSANAVTALSDRLTALRLELPAAIRLAAVGGATERKLAVRLRAADFTPSRSNVETLADELPDAAGQRVLFPRGDLARDTLARRLGRRGASVRDVVVYRTMAARGGDLATLVLNGGVDAIAFTSPSSIHFATGIVHALRRAGDAGPSIVCIGPTTARAAREIGMRVDAEAATQTVGGIVEALERHFTETQSHAFTPA